MAFRPADDTSSQNIKDITGGGFGRGVRSAEEQPEARMSRQGVTKVPRTAGRAGSRTPGLLRGGRPPLNTSACSGDLKLLTAWRAEPAQCIPAAKRTKPSHSLFAQRTIPASGASLLIAWRAEPAQCIPAAKRTKPSHSPFAQRTIPASGAAPKPVRAANTPPL